MALLEGAESQGPAAPVRICGAQAHKLMATGKIKKGGFMASPFYRSVSLLQADSASQG
jgi:hypothetical protein